MPRNGSGTHSLTTTFVANTPILSADVNTLLEDVADEITGSLAIDGQSTMTGALKVADGTITAPGVAFGSDTNTGFYRSASGVIRASCDGTNSFTATATGATVTGTLAVSGAITATGGFSSGGIIPAGGIIMWSGSVASIPSGWVICDGLNSTPDLRDRFIVGAGSTYAVAATGGSADAVNVSHTHTATVTDPGHDHSISFTGSNAGTTYADGSRLTAGVARNTSSETTGITVANSTEGESGTNKNLPPYYALAFIMKT